MTTSLEVEVHGTGDPVILVHGLGGSSNVFSPQMGVLSRFFKCVRPDLPGSARSASDGAQSLLDFADQIADIMDKEGGEKWHVIGHSMGTVVCLNLAVRRPDLVRSLGLVGPLLAPPESARTALRDRAAKARSEGLAGIADAIVQGGTSADTKAHRPEIAAFVREMIMRQDPEGYALSCEALAAVEAADVTKINVPTLLMTGDEDGTAPPRAVKALSEKIANSRFKLLERCGHWTTFERSAEVSNALLSFLLSVD